MAASARHLAKGMGFKSIAHGGDADANVGRRLDSHGDNACLEQHVQLFDVRLRYLALALLHPCRTFFRGLQDIGFRHLGLRS